MRQVINITNFEGKTIKISKEKRAEDHLLAQMRYKKQVFRDRTKYSRKVKHKKHLDDAAPLSCLYVAVL